ncbi:MAG: DegV family protein [Lachnospiraceae bacterium]|nr:DegV family protein [Lachnospiraceae bacterium]
MSSFIIATDTTADLPKDYIEKNDLGLFSLSYTIVGETYSASRELPEKEFYNLMREGNIPKTSQVNPDEAKEVFLKLLEKGNEILYIAFSSGLSGTYNSGRLAAEEIMEEDKNAKIVVVDSKCASLGEGLLVHKACEMRNSGKSFEETCEWVKEHAKNIIHLFTVDDLNHLFRGGRVSRSAAFIGTVLNIKPVLHVDDEGKLIPLCKERGRKKSLLKLVDMMGEQLGSYDKKNDIIFISHGDCIEDAEFVRDEVEKRYGIKDCLINYIGPTIGAHAGPGTVALFFMGDVR